MGRHVSIAIRMALVTIVVFGVLYPLAMTGIAQVLFPRQANGSLVKEHGKVVGSELIGQQFVGAGYFHSRPSAAGKGYDAASSGGSNLGPTSKALADTVSGRVEVVVRQNPGLVKGRVPVDMVTASASGLDPDISVANAYAQVTRVAKARGLSNSRVKELVDTNMIGRMLGFLGEPRINVLQINRALDALSGTVK
ncbi:MAG: potassium-transporting ATPase subunit KdpC [Armatimonadota bacterium]